MIPGQGRLRRETLRGFEASLGYTQVTCRPPRFTQLTPCLKTKTKDFNSLMGFNLVILCTFNSAQASNHSLQQTQSQSQCWSPEPRALLHVLALGYILQLLFCNFYFYFETESNLPRLALNL